MIAMKIGSNECMVGSGRDEKRKKRLRIELCLS